MTLVHGVTKKWPKIPRKFIPRCGQPSADKLKTEGRGGQKWHKIAFKSREVVWEERELE